MRNVIARSRRRRSNLTHAQGRLLRCARNDRERGFSLLEVLIGVAILAGMSLLIQSTMSRVLNAKEKVERRDTVVGAVQVALAKMADDLSQAFLAGTVVKGSGGGYETGMKGAIDHVDFTSLGHYHYVDDAKDTDQVSIGYFLKSAEGGLSDLYRRESLRLSDKIDEGGKSYPLIENVKEFALTYYDSNKEEWVPEWNTTQISALGRLPAAVKIRLEVSEMDGEEAGAEHIFETAVPIPLFKNEIVF